MQRQAHFKVPSVQGQRAHVQKGKIAAVNTLGMLSSVLQ